MPTIPAAIAIAIEHHQAGRLPQAEAICRQILEADPNHADAWHLLGLIACQLGRHQVAVEHIGQAIRLNGRKAEFYSNLGLAHQALGQFAEAVANYQRALHIRPDAAEAHNNLGSAFQAQGKLAEAVACYRRAVELKPGYTKAHNNLGIAFQAQGKLVEAVACYRRALELKPDYAGAHIGLGNALTALGKLDEAVACYRRAQELNPDLAETHYNLGNAFQEQGKLDEAVACYRRALELKPDDTKAHNNLGNAFRARGELDEAAACYRRALELRPGYAEAHNNLGIALQEQGKLDEALACYRRALGIRPDSAEAHDSLGNAFQELGKVDEAVACYRRALELKPDFVEAHIGLGNAFTAQKKLDEAVACYRRALELKPDLAETHYNLGNAFLEQGKVDEAVACHRRALELKPGHAEAHNNLGNAFRAQGKLVEAAACYRRALELKPDFAETHSNFVYTLIYLPGYDAQNIYEEHRRWNRQHAEALATRIQPYANDRSPRRRLRIGYVSAYFREHCQAFFTAPLFSSHDHENFEFFCYADVARPDGITAQLRSYTDVWRNITGLGDEQVAQLIREDRIDILVDLTMHMGDNHLLVFARKPAPVQVCWLAYPGTTGLSTMDYRLTDPYLDAPGLSDRCYSEESLRLPDAFWCYDPLTGEPAVNPLPALARGYITFGSLNNFCKVNTSVLELWARVLRTVAHSRLMMLSPEGSHRQEVRQLLQREGVQPERVTFVAMQPRQRYLGLYHGIDVGLDTFPYNGHTTSLDSYWMGVPVATIVGPTVVGRAGLSQLTNLGLAELVAETPDQFVSIAVALANDLPRLSQLRATLRDRMQNSPLMDAPRFARNIETAYRTMWQRWCAE